MKLLLDAFCTFLATLMPMLTDSIAFSGKYNDPSESGIVMVYVCTAEWKPPELRRASLSESDLSPYLFFICPHCPYAWLIGGKSWSTLEVFVWEIWGLNCISVGQFQYIYIYPFTRLRLTRYPLSGLLSSSRLNTPYTNLILGIFAIHMNILCRRFIEFIPTSEDIWCINHREID